MSTRSKWLLVASVALLAACSSLSAADFPTEDQLPLLLHQGMTPQQVRALFGSPNGTDEGRYKLEYHFYPSLSLLTGEHEGYMGFAVRFEHGRLVGWSPIRGDSSYEPPTCRRS